MCLQKELMLPKGSQGLLRIASIDPVLIICRKNLKLLISIWSKLITINRNQQIIRFSWGLSPNLQSQSCRHTPCWLSIRVPNNIPKEVLRILNIMHMLLSRILKYSSPNNRIFSSMASLSNAIPSPNKQVQLFLLHQLVNINSFPINLANFLRMLMCSRWLIKIVSNLSPSATSQCGRVCQVIC